MLKCFPCWPSLCRVVRWEKLSLILSLGVPLVYTSKVRRRLQTTCFKDAVIQDATPAGHLRQSEAVTVFQNVHKKQDET